MKRIETIYLIIGVCIGGLIGFSLALSYSNFWDNNINKIVINDNQTNIICNDTILKQQLENKEYTIKEYKLIIQNMHDNYNKQDYRFDKMLNYSIQSREELYQCYNSRSELEYLLRFKYNWSGEMY